MVNFIPLHLSVLDRSSRFKKWFSDALQGLAPRWMSPEDWFEALFMRKGTYVWTPPPSAGDMVVDQLGKANLREPGSLHIVVIPRLMTGR